MMSNANGDPIVNSVKRSVDVDRERDNVELLRVIRHLADQAHRERVRSTATFITIISAVFLFKQFVPPVWTIWF